MKSTHYLQNICNILENDTKSQQETTKISRTFLILSHLRRNSSKLAHSDSFFEEKTKSDNNNMRETWRNIFLWKTMTKIRRNHRFFVNKILKSCGIIDFSGWKLPFLIQKNTVKHLICDEVGQLAHICILFNGGFDGFWCSITGLLIDGRWFIIVVVVEWWCRCRRRWWWCGVFEWGFRILLIKNDAFRANFGPNPIETVAGTVDDGSPDELNDHEHFSSDIWQDGRCNEMEKRANEEDERGDGAGCNDPRSWWRRTVTSGGFGRLIGFSLEKNDNYSPFLDIFFETLIFKLNTHHLRQRGLLNADESSVFRGANPLYFGTRLTSSIINFLHLKNR